METPLSPLDFARRTRRLHADREAVVDGELRLSYRQFFDRCDRWSAALRGLGVRQGDRVATIAPNTHAQLEAFYAVPQIGAVLVPINYRLTAEDVVMEGYYQDPEATHRAMGDGWFHTGDAAVVHPDGYTQIRDRLKDVIITGGENISSIEVEGTLLRHPAIREVAVVGLPHEKWGETPHAFVVLNEDASTTEADVIAFARDHLAHFKAPSGVTFVSELPKTATGKIQKYVLRQGAPNLAAQ
jgi:acyl-CoA synthetase (AMP-forming)/AMP-acid ligase II